MTSFTGVLEINPSKLGTNFFIAKPVHLLSGWDRHEVPPAHCKEITQGDRRSLVVWEKNIQDAKGEKGVNIQQFPERTLRM